MDEIRQLTKKETAELYAVRTATPEQLLILAEKCGVAATIQNELVIIDHTAGIPWNPRARLCQNHLLLAAVIEQGDCRLFRDQEINEFFIYQYTLNENDGPPLAHHTELNDTVIAAAMNLWFPED